ncbi:MAG: hypothetical protein ACRD07_07810 [Acidimicrobiales bacterium]
MTRLIRVRWFGLMVVATMALLAAMPTAIEYAVMAGISASALD